MKCYCKASNQQIYVTNEGATHKKIRFKFTQKIVN